MATGDVGFETERSLLRAIRLTARVCHDMYVSLRKLALPLFVAVLCLGQATWQAETNPPGVDWGGLSAARKQTALRVMQTEGCA